MTLQQVSFLPDLHMDGFLPLWVDSLHLAISPGKCRDSTDSFDLISDSTLPIDPIFGAGGHDQGLYVTDATFAIYVIGDQYGYKPIASLTSSSFTQPVMPAGYNAFRRVGSAYINPLYVFADFTYIGSSRVRDLRYRENRIRTAALLDGHAITYTAVPLNFVPPTSTLATIGCDMQPFSNGNSLWVSPFGIETDPYIQVVAPVVGIANTVVVTDMQCPAQNIYYKATQAGDLVKFYVYGFKETV